MPIWEITGADRDTGEARTITADAPSKSAAFEYAANRGMLVTNAVPIKSSPPPRYDSLNLVCTIITAVGIAIAAVCVLICAAAVINAQGSPGGLAWLALQLAAPVGGIAVGLLMAAVGQAGLALRDIARSTWREVA